MPFDWRNLFDAHHRAADQHHGELTRERSRHHLDRIGLATVGALLAIGAAIMAGVVQLARIARALERSTGGRIVQINLTGRVVPKHGGGSMAGPFNPDETQDVDFAISPVNAAGSSVPATTIGWSVSDAAGGTLTVATDNKSAKLVTAAGPIDVNVTVTDSRTGVTDSARVTRLAADVNVANLNLTGTVVPKVP